MKSTARTLLLMICALGLVVTLASASYANDGGGCSLKRSAGNYGMTDSGTVIGVGPRTAVAVFTLDGAGNLINGSGTSSLNGSIAVETFNGTYTVNSDCTSTFSAQIYASGTLILNLQMNGVFDNGMRQFRGIFTSVTTPDGTKLPTVINLEARKQ